MKWIKNASKAFTYYIHCTALFGVVSLYGGRSISSLVSSLSHSLSLSLSLSHALSLLRTENGCRIEISISSSRRHSTLPKSVVFSIIGFSRVGSPFVVDGSNGGGGGVGVGVTDGGFRGGAAPQTTTKQKQEKTQNQKVVFLERRKKTFFPACKYQASLALAPPPAHGHGRGCARDSAAERGSRHAENKKKTSHIKVFASTSPSIDFLVDSFEKKPTERSFLEKTNNNFFGFERDFEQNLSKGSFFLLLVCLKLSYNIFVCLFDLREV